jgi:hypothetical protein
MNRYRSELLGNIRHARTQLITGLENPRISPVTREWMMSWISEAEDELIFRARQAGEIGSPVTVVAATETVVSEDIMQWSARV